MPDHGGAAPGSLAWSSAALSFGDQSAAYHAVRPGYPRAAVDWALPGHPARVLDLGAGTGILTASLRGSGRAVLAADPSRSMLARLVRALPGVPVVAAAAEAIPLRAASVDAVLAGSAFHWFTRPAADAEIARVLRPDGSVALLWNPVDPAHPLGAIFGRARLRLGLDAAEYDPGVELGTRWFGPTQRRTFPAWIDLPVGQFLQMLASRSYMLTAPAAQRTEILARSRRAAVPHAVQGRLRVPLAVTVLRASRR